MSYIHYKNIKLALEYPHNDKGDCKVVTADTQVVSGMTQSLDPLVDLLRDEMTRRGIAGPGRPPASPVAFTYWYLEVVQLLEASVAAGSGRQQMTRTEVELMCRCALTALDVGQAMALCKSYTGALHPRAGEIGLHQGNRELVFTLDSLRAETTSASQLCDITGLFAFLQLFQWLAGVDLRLEQVRIGPIERDDVMPFLKLFSAPVLAGGNTYALHFPAAVGALPVVRRIDEFDEFFEVYPCAVFGRGVADLSGQVAAILDASVRRGGGVPSQKTLADSLAMPLSTFRHRLRRSGTAFGRLREQCLREQALNLLEHGGYGVAEVASRLGFSDAAAFRRAFRRWYGCAPSRWLQSKADTAAP